VQRLVLVQSVREVVRGGRCSTSVAVAVQRAPAVAVLTTALWWLAVALSPPCWSADTSPAQELLDAGVDAAQLGQWSVAEEKLHEATRVDPQLAKAHYNLGLVFSKQGKREEAAAALQRAVRLQPVYPRAHCEYGYVLADLGKKDMALVHLKLAVEQEPALERARSRLQALEAQPQASEQASKPGQVGLSPEEFQARLEQNKKLVESYPEAQLAKFAREVDYFELEDAAFIPTTEKAAEILAKLSADATVTLPRVFENGTAGYNGQRVLWPGTIANFDGKHSIAIRCNEWSYYVDHVPHRVMSDLVGAIREARADAQGGPRVPASNPLGLHIEAPANMEPAVRRVVVLGAIRGTIKLRSPDGDEISVPALNYKRIWTSY
jgi:tetratricopeptide (TPR) repeat protein